MTRGTAVSKNAWGRCSNPTGRVHHEPDDDLRRLPAHGIVVRLPRSHRSMLTAQGRRIALFMAKACTIVVRPIFHRLDPSKPEDATNPLGRAWRTCKKKIDEVVTEARLAA